jgi:hypothetical protein
MTTDTKENETLSEILERNKDAIEKQLMASFTERVTNSLNYSLSYRIEEYAAAYVKEKVLPDVHKILTERHDEIVKTLVAGVQAGVDSLGMKIAEAITKNLSGTHSDYKIRKALKELIE